MVLVVMVGVSWKHSIWHTAFIISMKMYKNTEATNQIIGTNDKNAKKRYCIINEKEIKARKISDSCLRKWHLAAQ